MAQSRWKGHSAALRPIPSSMEFHPEVRTFVWGRGSVLLIPSDPFGTDLPAPAEETWRRFLAGPSAQPLADQTLLGIAPLGPGLGGIFQLIVALTLAAYLVLLRPLARWAGGSRGAKVVAVGVLLGFAAVAGVLGRTAGQGMTGLVRAAVAEVPPDLGMARVEGYGRVALQDGVARLEVQDGMLMRALGPAELTIELGGPRSAVVRSESRLVPVRLSGLLSLDVAGRYRPGDGMDVEIENRSGSILRDGLVALDGRVQPVPDIGARLRQTLPEFGWRDPPTLEHARGLVGRMTAWALGRLPRNAIISPTVYLVAWLHDDRSRQIISRRSAPLLVIVPLSRVEASP